MFHSKKIIRRELIGICAEVIESRNSSLLGIKGKIIDETKSTISIKTKQGEKKIIKKECTFRFFLPEESIEIKGCFLVGRPEKRISKNIPKKRI